MEQLNMCFKDTDISYYKEIYIDVVDPTVNDSQEYLPISINGDLYLFLKLFGVTLEDKEEQISVQDYFMLDDVALDCKNGLFRIYPKLPNNYLAWDPTTHTIKSVKDYEGEYRLA